MAPEVPFLQLRSVGKRFGEQSVLRGVSFDVKAGEFHAVMGENGAGKSTLMKVLCGLYASGSYEGEFLLEGRPCRFRGTREAEEAGVGIIFQELALVPALSVAENLFLGAESADFGVLRLDEMRSRAGELLAHVGLDVSPETPVSSLAIGQQQLVEIAKALGKDARLLILDEPTAALSEGEAENLFARIAELRARGVTCLYISHRLPEVYRLADRITVLRDGGWVTTRAKADFPEDELIRAMVGRELTERYPASTRKAEGRVLLSVRDWTVEAPAEITGEGRDLQGVSFEARAGEILGFAGLMGAGRSELMLSLLGLWGRRVGGEMRLEGEASSFHGIADAMARGLCYVTEDRKRYGIVGGMGVRENLSLANLARFASFGVIQPETEIRSALDSVRDLGVRCFGLEQKVGSLSGGNQQKVVVGKWLLADPKVLILDEPTRGVDVGAKYEMYAKMNELASRGMCIVLVSSDLPELLGMADRILVMREGALAGAFRRRDATQEKIMSCAAGRRAA